MSDDNKTTPPPAPGLDLDAVKRSASLFAKYHTEHARFGGASREFHERAETFIGATVRALIAEVRALRAAIAEAKRLGLEACALADGGIDEPLDATAVERIGAKTAAIAAALEAL